MATGTDRRRRAVVLALAVMVAAVGAAAYFPSAWHGGPVLWPDACGYLSAARMLATKGVFALNLVQLNPRTLASPADVDPIGWWPPAYPALLALAAGRGATDPDRLLGATLAVDLVGEAVAAVGLGVLVWLAAENAAAGLIAAGLYLLCGPSMSEAPKVLSEHLFMPLAAWAMVAQLVLIRRGGWGLAAVTGLLWGLAALTRHWGVLLAGCAAVGAYATLAGATRRAKMQAAALPLAIAWACWLAWAVRNLALAGSVGGYYAPSGGSFQAEITKALSGYFYGFAANLYWPHAMPRLALMVRGASVGAVGLGLAAIIVVLWSERKTAAEGQRWPFVLWTALLSSAATLAGLAALRTVKVINFPGGRMLVWEIALTMAALMVAAVRSPQTRVLAVALGLCVVVGGVEQGFTNLLLPSGGEQMAESHILADDARLQELVGGKRLLLVGQAGMRPAPDLLTAGVFLPTARTIYWADDPLYSGVVIGEEEVRRMVRSGEVDYLLARPLLVPSEPAEPAAEGKGLARLRYVARGLWAGRLRRELVRCVTMGLPLGLATRPVARVGEWVLEEPVYGGRADHGG